MNQIVIICGPTASGKSDHALRIAQNNNGVIINADAMQIYKELDILTARPTSKQQKQAPHRLYGILPAREKCSVAKWLGLARVEIDRAQQEGHLPIVTGGTGLYIKALMEGLSPIPDIADRFRLEATRLWEEEGASALKVRDAIMAKKLKEGDMQRHVRALEVMLATGKSIACWQSLPREKPYPEATFDVQYVSVERSELYRRCDVRFLAMMEQGALEEAHALHAMNLSDDMPARRAVGVKELFLHLEGKHSLEEAVRRAQQATRNYAKRQMTWFRHQLPALQGS